MKDLGEAAYVLGIKICRDRSRRLIALSQSAYLEKVLKRFRMDQSKKGFLHVQKGNTLSLTQCPAIVKKREVMSSMPYASTIGSIMYVMLCTQPDVALALSLTSRFQSNPGMIYWTAVKNILRHHRRTSNMVLVYGGCEEELGVKVHVDASFDTDPDDSKSQTGYMFMVNEGAVS
jgi:hypothetical protein